MKRSESPHTSPLQNTDGKEKKIDDQPHSRIKKVKMAIIVSYVGRGYSGMQYMKDTPTIEKVLENALYESNCISEDNKHNLQKVSWNRCARTDKGVSAANNIVSLKMGIDGDFITRINSHLPETIHVHSAVKVPGSFNAKNRVDSRDYEYFFPSYALQRVDPTNPTINTSYEPTTEDLDYLNSVLKAFCGTHNFQNFTFNKKNGKPSDKSNTRYIIEVSAQLVKLGSMGFVAVSIRGQSFMIWQIRRMMGFAVVLTNLRFPLNESLEFMKKSFSLINWRHIIPTAPPFGLFLERCNFDTYNKKLGEDKLPINNEETLKQCKEFKEKYIWNDIADHEVKEHAFGDYMKEVRYQRIFDVLSGKVDGEIEEQGDDGKENTEGTIENIPTDDCVEEDK
ncbi:tRNA pseudouridine synthase A [Entamoeba marina]